MQNYFPRPRVLSKGKLRSVFLVKHNKFMTKYTDIMYWYFNTIKKFCLTKTKGLSFKTNTCNLLLNFWLRFLVTHSFYWKACPIFKIKTKYYFLWVLKVYILLSRAFLDFCQWGRRIISFKNKLFFSCIF